MGIFKPFFNLQKAPLKTFYFVSGAQVMIMAAFHLLMKGIVFRGALISFSELYYITAIEMKQKGFEKKPNRFVWQSMHGLRR